VEPREILRFADSAQNDGIGMFRRTTPRRYNKLPKDNSFWSDIEVMVDDSGGIGVVRIAEQVRESCYIRRIYGIPIRKQF
jgi:hypothetical protein